MGKYIQQRPPAVNPQNHVSNDRLGTDTKTSPVSIDVPKHDTKVSQHSILLDNGVHICRKPTQRRNSAPTGSYPNRTDDQTTYNVEKDEFMKIHAPHQEVIFKKVTSTSHASQSDESKPCVEVSGACHGAKACKMIEAH